MESLFKAGDHTIIYSTRVVSQKTTSTNSIVWRFNLASFKDRFLFFVHSCRMDTRPQFCKSIRTPWEIWKNATKHSYCMNTHKNQSLIYIFLCMFTQNKRKSQRNLGMIMERNLLSAIDFCEKEWRIFTTSFLLVNDVVLVQSQ